MNYLTRVIDNPDDINASAWDALLAQQARATPFMRHAFLAALHRAECAVAHTGWTPRFITLWQDSALVAAAPVYFKTHSFGEYVFDWSWAQAYQQHGLRYYPKLLCATPFTPVPGPRLMAQDAHSRAALVRALRALAQSEGLSSAHVLFVDEADKAALVDAGWMLRESVQFHWTQDASQRFLSFEAFLAGLLRHKRKNILQERRKVLEAGVRFTVHEGADIDAPMWDFFHHCYTLTYQAHRSSPYLTRAFFAEMARTMPQHWLMFVAHRGDQPIAASLIAIDRAQRAAWGRYWGATEAVPCLHFEACYYQPLAWCIAQEFLRFEGGAQGEHKMARGLLPVKTASAHWLSDPRFASAVADFLAREGAGVEAWVDELREHGPFKAGPAPVESQR